MNASSELARSKSSVCSKADTPFAKQFASRRKPTQTSRPDQDNELKKETRPRQMISGDLDIDTALQGATKPSGLANQIKEIAR